MKIEEAIKHCEEVADSAMANYRLDEELYGIEDDECLRYADEYRQLAEWLRELEHLRNLVAYSIDFDCTIREAEIKLRKLNDAPEIVHHSG